MGKEVKKTNKPKKTEKEVKEVKETKKEVKAEEQAESTRNEILLTILILLGSIVVGFFIGKFLFNMMS